MDFDFTQEQVMLRGLTREFLNRESSPRALREQMDEGRRLDAAIEANLRELGFGD